MFFLHHRNRWWKFYHADLPPAPVEDMAWKRGVRNKYYLRKRSHLNLYMPSIYRRLTDKAHRGLAATVTSLVSIIFGPSENRIGDLSRMTHFSWTGCIFHCNRQEDLPT